MGVVLFELKAFFLKKKTFLNCVLRSFKGLSADKYGSTVFTDNITQTISNFYKVAKLNHWKEQVNLVIFKRTFF